MPFFKKIVFLSTCLGVAAFFSACASSPSFATENQWNACLDRLQKQALDSGVQPDTWKSELTQVAPNLTLLDRLNSQPEFVTPVWDYMAALVDPERIEEGLKALRQYQVSLEEAQKRYGVEPAVIVAVWGVESGYGRSLGNFPIVRSLATLSCMGRRQAFFSKELFAALRIVQSQDFPRASFKGSWAGAFGQTQFMPSTFERLAVDLDGDGRRDIIHTHADALGSTARYLQDAGWVKGQVWGVEVKLPASLVTKDEGRKVKRSLRYWKEKGVMAANGSPLRLSDDIQAGLLMPAGVEGPVFLVTANFDAIYRYNASENYALAIAHLSDRLLGKPAFVKAWPTDDQGLSRAQRRELQQLLIKRGHEIGEPDGLIGERTRQAIGAEQTRLGHSVTKRAGQKLLRALDAGE